MAELRSKAEQAVAGEAHPASAVSEVDARALLHELHVHQIELEMQNDELQRAQAAAQEASERYSDLFDFAPVAYFLWDHEGRILEVNLAEAALLGLDRSTVVHKLFGQFVAVEDRVRFADFCHQMLLADAKQTCEIKILKDGQTVNALIEGLAAQDRQGQGKVCRAAVIDISQQKRADELAAANRAMKNEIVERKRAEAERQKFVSLANQSTEFIGMCDMEYRPFYVNEAGRHLVGLDSLEEACRTTVSEFYFPEDQRFITDEFFPRVLREGRAEVEIRFRHFQTGAAIWIICNVFYIRDATGQPVGLATVSRNITERKRAEEALVRAKAAAEQANRAKDHFLAVLSHELRTPLTPVVMGVSMLQDRSDLAPAVRETLEMIGRSIAMEARLIDDLLDVSRIARSKIELRKQRVELCMVIRQAAEVCKPEIEARRLCVGVDMGPAAPYWVEADASRLQQVFWNLLKNAIKFTPHDGCVGICCRPDQDHLLVEINDSGIGIEQDALGRVFSAFEQEERSITRQFGGLGLGLAISKALVEMHGGTIEAHSEGRNKGRPSASACHWLRLSRSRKHRRWLLPHPPPCVHCVFYWSKTIPSRRR